MEVSKNELCLYACEEDGAGLGPSASELLCISQSIFKLR